MMKMLLRAVVVAAAIVPTLGHAEHRVTGADVQRALAGKSFTLRCIDGTFGRGFVTARGAVTVSYKRSAAREDAAELVDHAVVRAQGDQICISWKQFDGGGHSCYPVAMMAPSQYRLGGDGRWCDINAK